MYSVSLHFEISIDFGQHLSVLNAELLGGLRLNKLMNLGNLYTSYKQIVEF